MWYNNKVARTWPIGQAVKTLASHAGNSGSIPGWVTKIKKDASCVLFCFAIYGIEHAHAEIKVKISAKS